ncbi:serpin family protein [Ornithinimicrobium sufpigmenti]|uniref:serpin family protein n=1 Tax=Ornithinimicrobium sufpigmenti TaxID=2508882 RepID=UPI00192D928A|nr:MULTISPECIES: serpin family protein [unclassified Ornithinimicrobium]
MGRYAVTSAGRTVLVALGLALPVTACGDHAVPAPVQLDSAEARDRVDPAEAVALADLVTAADSLGLTLLDAADDVTTVTSPASLQVTLSMAAEGADGETLAELEVLIGASGQERTDGINALSSALSDLDGDPAVAGADELPDDPVVHRASRLLLDDSLTVQQDFVDVLARSYDAPAETTDLGGDGAQQVLDAWVEEHTGGLVPHSAITPGPELRLALQDAVVLAARWEQPFLADLTRPRPFTTASGEQVEVDMMATAAPRETLYAEVEGWQAVRLPYTGGRLVADVILPPVGSSATTLPPEVLEELLLTGETRPVLLQMPVVDARSSLDLAPFLADRAPAALKGGLGGISDEPLSVSQLAQQGVLTLDEEGTLAAAVTEMGLAGSAEPDPPFVLTVDRPYLVRVSDDLTGWPLFLAHIADPRGGPESR